MPKDYSQGKIYQMEPICEYEEGDIYIGSTCQKFISNRLAEHIYDYRYWKKEKGPFVSSYVLFEKYGIDNMRIILLESYPCNSNDELRSREAHYQKILKCINKCIAFRNKEERLEWARQHYKENIDKYLQYRQEHREEISEKHKHHYQEHKQEISEKKKHHYQEHKQEIKERTTKYYHEHKQEISEKSKEKITCECGREVRKNNLKRHQCSDIHKELMTKIV